MFWADRVAHQLKDKGPQWVDDMKTPSGRIHVGALRGVVIHDLVFKSLIETGNKAKYTYVFDNHDPMDALPVYLPKEKYEKYLGVPLYKVPSPEEGFENYAQYYALEFKNVFNAIGCNPEIIWATDLYLSGKMNPLIKECLDKSDIIRKIYEELYKKEVPKNWYPFQVYCPNCDKVSTTSAHDWDGEKVSFICGVDRIHWTKGCGHEGKISPFSTKDHMAGKLPWKIEWPCKWKVIGVTVEGAGKDHMSRGGSHDLASLICKRVLNYPVPYPVAYEHFLFGGKKMSSSKGIGSSATEMAEILPPEILRFLMVKTNYKQAINFDPEGETILQLFDDYDRYAKEFFDHGNQDMARVFELSQIDLLPSKKTNFPRFRDLATFIQMPGVDIKKQFSTADPEILEERVKYAKIWLEKYAPEEKKFTVQKNLPPAAKNLTTKQKELLLKISQELNKKWQPEDFQNHIYKLGKDLNLSSAETFQAIYLSLLGKTHGPKASWLILSLEKEFVQKRFQEAAKN